MEEGKYDDDFHDDYYEGKLGRADDSVRERLATLARQGNRGWAGTASRNDDFIVPTHAHYRRDAASVTMRL